MNVLRSAAVSQGLEHSEKAMSLSRKMRQSRHKRKTGQVICHHLRMMLAEDLPREKLVRPRLANIDPATVIRLDHDNQFSLVI